MKACESQQQLHGDGLRQRLRAMWPENLERHSVTMLLSGGHPDNALASAFVA